MFSILNHVVTIGESSYRLGVLLKVLPFPYLICFLGQERVQELDVLLVVHPLRWFFGLLG